jgi:DUF3037 family protein
VRAPFDYAIVRVVPRVEREEFVNAGVVLHCRPRRFLAARIKLDEARLAALDPSVDLELVRSHLAAFERVAAGDAAAGPIAALPQPDRFHWLVAPRSTLIQTSAVHSGVSEDPEAELGCILREMVAR